MPSVHHKPRLYLQSPFRGGYMDEIPNNDAASQKRFVASTSHLPPSMASQNIPEDESQDVTTQKSPLSVDMNESATAVEKLEGADRRFSSMVGIVEFFNVFAQTIPIILMPVIASEQSGASSIAPAAFVAMAASLSTFGAGMGKLVNGYVCQSLGGGRAMSIYMTAMALGSLVFSFNKSTVLFGWILASMEFCMSMQWTACSVVLANHFDGHPVNFATAITTLSFMSMAGVLAGKTGGTALLPLLGSWQAVARVGAIVSVCGALMSHFFLTEHTRVSAEEQEKTSFVESFKDVVSKPIFWIFAFVHGTLFLARTSDRILGSFYAYTSGLPESICGGLTMSVTVGFLHGLSRGRIFQKLQGTAKKLRFIRNNYAVGAAATLGLALCGGPWLPQLMASKVARAAVVAGLSGIMASTLSFQFFQIPGIVAPEFGRNKAVFFSLVNGAGYFSATFVWAGFAQLIHRLQHGWTLAWLMLMALYVSGGTLLLRNFGPILAKREKME